MIRSISLIMDIFFILVHSSMANKRIPKILQLDKQLCMTIYKISNRVEGLSAKEFLNNITDYNGMLQEQIQRFRDNKVSCIPFVHDFFQNHGPSFRRIGDFSEAYEEVFKLKKVRKYKLEYEELITKTDKLWHLFKTLYFHKVIDRLEL